MCSCVVFRKIRQRKVFINILSSLVRNAMTRQKMMLWKRLKTKQWQDLKKWVHLDYRCCTAVHSLLISSQHSENTNSSFVQQQATIFDYDANYTWYVCQVQDIKYTIYGTLKIRSCWLWNGIEVYLVLKFLLQFLLICSYERVELIGNVVGVIPRLHPSKRESRTDNCKSKQENSSFGTYKPWNILYLTRKVICR